MQKEDGVREKRKMYVTVLPLFVLFLFLLNLMLLYYKTRIGLAQVT